MTILNNISCFIAIAGRITNQRDWLSTDYQRPQSPWRSHSPSKNTKTAVLRAVRFYTDLYPITAYQNIKKFVNIISVHFVKLGIITTL